MLRDKRSRPRADGGIDAAALPELINRMHRAAWAICGSRQDAEDLVQETFSRVLARPRDLQGDPAPYLMKALRNTHLTSLRTASRRPRTSELPAEEDSALASTVGRPEVALEHGRTFEAIAALSGDHREALVAVDVVGLSYREAADVMGTREKTIATRLFRAREAVARMLEGETESMTEGVTA